MNIEYSFFMQGSTFICGFVRSCFVPAHLNKMHFQAKRASTFALCGLRIHNSVSVLHTLAAVQKIHFKLHCIAFHKFEVKVVHIFTTLCYIDKYFCVPPSCVQVMPCEDFLDHHKHAYWVINLRCVYIQTVLWNHSSACCKWACVVSLCILYETISELVLVVMLTVYVAP